MRSLAGCVALAVMLAGGPLAAEEDLAAAVAELSITGPVKIEIAPPITIPEPKLQAATAADPAAPARSALDPMAWPLQEQLPPPPPPITLVLKADLRAQRVTVIENGREKHVWPISSGLGGYATKTGTFQPQWASRMWHSRQYGYAPMPHAVFFHRGTAFHGTGAVGNLGRPASHGCIRLAPGNAAQLFKLVHKHGYAQTKIVVFNGSRSREPAVAARSGSRRQVASAQPAPRRGYRVSRTTTRQSPYRPF